MGCISFTFDLTDRPYVAISPNLLPRALVACAMLERTSGFEPLCETTAPKYLKHVTVPSFCPFTLISLWMPKAVGRMQWSIKSC